MTGSAPRMVRTGAPRWLLTAAAAVLVAHGLLHLLGVALLWRWGQPGELSYDDVWPTAASVPGMIVGGLWLAAALLFLLAAALLVAGRPAWRPIGLLAALLSIGVLLPSASIAWAGLLVDVAVLVAVAAAVVTAHRTTRHRGAGRTR